MREITKFEPLPSKMAVKILMVGYPVVTDIDEAAGCGIIDANTRCVWTKQGNRIEVSMGGGALIVNQSKEVDPAYPNGAQP
jgi:hypothetical protein